MGIRDGAATPRGRADSSSGGWTIIPQCDTVWPFYQLHGGARFLLPGNCNHISFLQLGLVPAAPWHVLTCRTLKKTPLMLDERPEQE